MVRNGRNEPVATPRYGFHKSGILRRIAQRIPHLADGAVDCVVEIDKGVAVPELLLNLFPSDHFAGAIDQEAQNLEWLLLNFDANAAFPQFADPEVQLEDAKIKHGYRAGRSYHRCPP